VLAASGGAAAGIDENRADATFVWGLTGACVPLLPSGPSPAARGGPPCTPGYSAAAHFELSAPSAQRHIVGVCERLASPELAALVQVLAAHIQILHRASHTGCGLKSHHSPRSLGRSTARSVISRPVGR
jgi:hypothetical protein